MKNKRLDKISNWALAFCLSIFSATTTLVSAGVSFVHTDHLGAPQKMTNENGTVVWSADYKPFGEVVINSDPDGDGSHSIMPLRFPGQYHDPETGLYYNYYRDYDSSLGRYIQSDPIGLRGGINTYGYVMQNPLRYIDPLGLEVRCVPSAKIVHYRGRPVVVPQNDCEFTDDKPAETASYTPPKETDTYCDVVSPAVSGASGIASLTGIGTLPGTIAGYTNAACTLAFCGMSKSSAITTSAGLAADVAGMHPAAKKAITAADLAVTTYENATKK